MTQANGGPRANWMADRNRGPISRRTLLGAGLAGLFAPLLGQTESLAADLPIPGAGARAAFAADLTVVRTGGRVRRGSYRIVEQNLRLFTNRKRTGYTSVVDQFGSDRSETPSYGKAKIVLTIPRGSSLPDRSELKEITPLDEQAFFDLSRQGVHSRSAIVWVPGYNNDLEEVLNTGARLKSIIGTKARMLVLSWPSAAGFWGYLGYLRDIAEVDFAAPFLRQTLINLLRSADLDRVQIVVHSLGARAVVWALKAIYDSPAERPLLKRISEIAFAAPDVDQDVMDRDFLPVADYADFVTCLYVSNKDLAMKASEFLNGRPRAGSTNKRIYVRKQINTIEVNAVDSSRWGHSAFFESVRIANDLHYFLNQHLPAKDRYGLRLKTLFSGSYWCMQP
jgi:esterase/lipase superfamily enzyme